MRRYSHVRRTIPYMRYVILGAGAVGGVVGGLLAVAGHEVALIARGEHLAAVRRDGLTLHTPDVTHQLRRIRR